MSRKKSRRGPERPTVAVYDEPIGFKVYGEENIEPEALEQMRNACRLPITVAGALMADGHCGYGLPIGGVLAVRDAVIPYAVGVDIACRMKLSVVPEKVSYIDGMNRKLAQCLESETRFGMGAQFSMDQRRDHDVMEDPTWGMLSPELKPLRDKAWAQLGTSGSGNHFVEWGELRLTRPALGLEPGSYIALLSHSGSRGLGSNIAKYFTNLAIEACPLEGQLKHLAWLSTRSQAGMEYWAAMELAGKYAQANHDLIHHFVLRAAGFKAAVQVDNHHNFAWREVHDGQEVIVHRKGATPAQEGVIGVIPGSMGDPGFVVRGRGVTESLQSASHGAGRRMSRRAARESITRSEVKKYLAERNVELLAGGIDEAPGAYKSIESVMAAQSGLVDVLAAFYPRIVLMSEDKESED